LVFVVTVHIFKWFIFTFFCIEFIWFRQRRLKLFRSSSYGNTFCWSSECCNKYFSLGNCL
jgi:hypothetical protein